MEGYDKSEIIERRVRGKQQEILGALMVVLAIDAEKCSRN